MAENTFKLDVTNQATQNISVYKVGKSFSSKVLEIANMAPGKQQQIYNARLNDLYIFTSSIGNLLLAQKQDSYDQSKMFVGENFGVKDGEILAINIIQGKQIQCRYAINITTIHYICNSINISKK